MIKLIATDLDGTLFYPKHRITGIPRRNRAFLKRYFKQGGNVVLVSGRNPKVLEKVETQLHHQVDLIGCNGAYSLDSTGFHDEKPIPKDKLLDLYAVIHRNYGIWLWMYFDESKKLHCNTTNVPEWIARGFYFGNFFRFYFAETLIGDDKAFLKQIAEGDCYKMLIAFGLGEDGKRKAAQAAPAIYEKFHDSLEVAVSDNAIEITAKGVTKGAGLEAYCKIHGYSKDEVFVCGDSGNDLTMFSCFPHTFAMNHSTPFFKSRANHVINYVSDLEDYLENPSSYEKDEIKSMSYQKALENLG